MAGRAAAGAVCPGLPATAPAACLDPQEQRRPASAWHSPDPRPGGADGDGHRARADLRGGPAAEPVRFPPEARRQNGGSPRLLAHHGQRTDRGGGRGSARLLREHPAWSAAALRGATGRGRHGAVRDQELAGDTGGRAHTARRPAHHRGAESTPGDAAGRDLLAPAEQPLLPSVPAGLGAARPPPEARCPRRQLRR